MAKPLGSRLMNLVLALALLTSGLTLPTSVIASNGYPLTGVCGDNLTWSLDENGVFTISGTGDMHNYVSSNRPYPSREITAVIITPGVTSIGDYAFRECSILGEVTIPSTVTRIGYGVFYNCNKLIELNIPEEVTSIGNYAFASCTSLQKVNLPQNITTIAENLFQYCYSLEEIIIPQRVTAIGSFAFSGCRSLVEIDLPESITTIEYYAFAYCTNLKEITLPPKITYLNEAIFYECTALSRVTLPPDLLIIRYAAFYGCSALTAIELPATLHTIRDYAFYACSALEGINLPENLQIIAYSVFANCTALQGIDLPENLTILGNGAFRNCPSLTYVSIPPGIDHLEGSMFYNCYALAQVTLPPTMTIIYEEAFFGCSALTDIVFPESLNFIHPDAFTASGLKTLNLPSSLTNLYMGAFQHCQNLVEVAIPDNITRLENYMFSYCGNLATVILPDTLTSLGVQTFAHCQNLQTINIPATVTFIGANAFLNCPNVTLYVFPGSYGEEYALANGLAFVSTAYQTVTLKVEDPLGNPLSSGFTVNWYEGDNPGVIATGSSVNLGFNEGQTYQVEVLLGETLKNEYLPPGRLPLELGDSNTFTITLHKRAMVTLNGRVSDSNGVAVVGAVIRVAQSSNGQFSLTQSVFSGEDGSFSISVAQLDTGLTVAASGYFNQSLPRVVTADTPETINLGNIVLQSLEGNKITLALSGHMAAADGVSREKYSLNTFYGLEFTLDNLSQNSPVPLTNVQYPFLIFDPAGVFPGDELEISVSDTMGKVTAPPLTITLDANLESQGELLLLNNGCFTARVNKASLVIVFNAQGDFVTSFTGSEMVQSASLVQGSYTVAFLEQTGLLSKVLHISKLTGLGLVANRDYHLIEVEINNGQETSLGVVNIPLLPAEQLSYTKSLYFSGSKQTMVLGTSLLSCRLEYEIDSTKNTSGETVRFELPPGLEFVGSSVTINNVPTAFSYLDKVLTVFSHQKSGIIRFCVEPSLAGQHFITAFLSLLSEGSSITQPLGQISLEVTAMELSAPFSSGDKSIIVSGYASASSQITLYDNGVIIGQTKANGNGHWQLQAELYKPLDNTVHQLYAEAESVYGVKVTSPERDLFYAEAYADLSRVTMYYNNQSVVFNFQAMTEVIPYYTYNPAITAFTFVVAFRNPEVVTGDVFVVTEDGDKRTTMIPTEYDSITKLWVGTGNFHTPERPVKVGVEYHSREAWVEETLLDEELFQREFREQWSSFGDILEDMELGDIILEALNQVYEDYYISVDYEILYTIDDMEYARETTTVPGLGVFTWSNSLLPPGTNPASLEAEGYQLLTVDEGELYLKSDAAGSYMADLARGELFTLLFSPQEEIGSDLTRSSASLAETAISIALDIIKNLNIVVQDATDILLQATLPPTLIPHYEYLKSSALELIKMLGEEIASINASMDRISKYNELRQRMADHRPRGLSCAFFSTSIAGGLSAEVAYLASSLSGITKAVAAYKIMFQALKYSSTNIATILGKKFVKSFVEGKVLEYLVKGTYNYVNKLVENHLQTCHCQCMNGSPWCACRLCYCQKPRQPVNSILDPSGFLYEAVLTNRVQGAIATLYYGESQHPETGILWNAGEFDQVNPLLTDAHGAYAWDVPQGWWQVKFEKENYVTGYSDWLPVPPPQTEINIGLVSLTPPTVAYSTGYQGRVEVTFDKYMEIETLTPESITLPGYSQNYSLLFADAEADPGMPQKSYARVVHIIPEELFALDEVITVNINSEAKSYAGVSLAPEYLEEVNILAEPQRVIAPTTVNLNYKETRALEVSIFPAEAGRKLKVNATSSSPLLVAITDEATTDEYATAILYVTGELSGSAELTLSIEGTQISHTIQVHVVLPNRIAQAETICVSIR